MRFVFSIRGEEEEPPTSLSLGDLEVGGQSGSISSAAPEIDRSFWVYLSIPDLVAGLTELADGRYSSYRFEAMNSPFAISFVRERDQISAKAYGTLLGTEPIPDVLAGLHAGVDAFADENPLDAGERYSEEYCRTVAAIRARSGVTLGGGEKARAHHGPEGLGVRHARRHGGGRPGRDRR